MCSVYLCEFAPALIVDGKNVAEDSSWNTPQPRAVIGQSDRLESMMVVVEGRMTDYMVANKRIP